MCQAFKCHSFIQHLLSTCCLPYPMPRGWTLALGGPQPRGGGKNVPQQVLLRGDSFDGGGGGRNSLAAGVREDFRRRCLKEEEETRSGLAHPESLFSAL